MRVLENFLPLYDPSVHEITANTPRASGKSVGIAQKVAHLVDYTCRDNPHDVVVFRAHANSLEASVMSEIEEQLSLRGAEYTVHKDPMRIEVNGCTIYFLGVSGHDRSRVRGFRPSKKLVAIIGDECQQISSAENLKHALATFRRYIDDTSPWKVALCGNPHEVKAHWWNVYCEQTKTARTQIKCTWRDLAKHGLLNQSTIDDIKLEKQLNPALYRFMYEGDISELSGGAYPSFKRAVHLISPEKAAEITRGERIEHIIWGGDGAITRDSTAIVPIAVMTSGRALVLERFIFDPIRFGRALAPSELTDLIVRYVDDMDRKYSITRDGVIGSTFVVDCASEDLIQQLCYQLNPYHTVKAYTLKNVMRNNSCVNNVFARGMVYIVDYGGYMDYASGRFHQGPDVLSDQLESVVWKNNRYDPAIPNDVSDAFTYGVSAYYENPYNLYLPERKKSYENA